MLTNAGANVLMEGKHNRTAMEIADSRGFTESAIFLQNIVAKELVKTHASKATTDRPKSRSSQKVVPQGTSPKAAAPVSNASSTNVLAQSPRKGSLAPAVSPHGEVHHKTSHVAAESKERLELLHIMVTAGIIAAVCVHSSDGYCTQCLTSDSWRTDSAATSAKSTLQTINRAELLALSKVDCKQLFGRVKGTVVFNRLSGFR